MITIHSVHRAWIACLTLFCLIASALGQVTAPVNDPRPVPDLGLIWNNDGDLSFTGATPQESIDIMLTIDALAASARKGVAIDVDKRA